MTDDYERGFAEGRASRDADIEALERVADFWYFRANNPRSEWPEVKMVNSIIDGKEANEERARRYAELDAEEQRKFQEARGLLAEGLSDIDVARKVGLLVTVVANLRSGVL